MFQIPSVRCRSAAWYTGYNLEVDKARSNVTSDTASHARRKQTSWSPLHTVTFLDTLDNLCVRGTGRSEVTETHLSPVHYSKRLSLPSFYRVNTASVSPLPHSDIKQTVLCDNFPLSTIRSLFPNDCKTENNNAAFVASIPKRAKEFLFRN